MYDLTIADGMGILTEPPIVIYLSGTHGESLKARRLIIANVPSTW